MTGHDDLPLTFRGEGRGEGEWGETRATPPLLRRLRRLLLSPEGERAGRI